MAKFAPHMGDPHGDPQTSPQHADPHGFFVWFSTKRHQVHLDRRVVGWSAGRHMDHPCGGQISPWPARKVTDFGEIQMGAHKRGLKPQMFREIGQKSFLEKRAFSVQLGAFSGPIGAFSGLIGTNSSAPHSHGEEQKFPRKGLFGPDWRLLGQAPVC